jgi:hypothetical protein
MRLAQCCLKEDLFAFLERVGKGCSGVEEALHCLQIGCLGSGSTGRGNSRRSRFRKRSLFRRLDLGQAPPHTFGQICKVQFCAWALVQQHLPDNVFQFACIASQFKLAQGIDELPADFEVTIKCNVSMLRKEVLNQGGNVFRASV